MCSSPREMKNNTKTRRKIESCIDDAAEALESANWREVKASLEEAKAIIATREKHIVLADMHGWDFVSEYKDIPIAEDDCDEKRIRTVLKAVESKRERRKAEKAKKAIVPKPNFNARYNNVSIRPINNIIVSEVISAERQDIFGGLVSSTGQDHRAQLLVDDNWFPSNQLQSCLLQPSLTNDLSSDVINFVDYELADFVQFSENSVQGRIASNKSWWFNTLNLSSFVYGVLSRDYCIPFVYFPPPCLIKNNKSALNHDEFVRGAISELLFNRCVAEVSVPPYCCNPLSVVEGRKFRLVLDLSRSVNPFVQRFKFKYEGLATLSSMLNRNDWFFTFDIESGYHHIDINCDYLKFLGFSFLGLFQV